jgi:hypothetical protein
MKSGKSRGDASAASDASLFILIRKAVMPPKKSSVLPV